MQMLVEKVTRALLILAYISIFAGETHCKSKHPEYHKKKKKSTICFISGHAFICYITARQHNNK